MIGLSLAYLPGNNFREVCCQFYSLQKEFNLEACEIHMECNQFQSAYYLADNLVDIAELRSQVNIMGIHLPYLDLNPISKNPLIAQNAMKIYKQAIISAAAINADYVVFHARSSLTGQGDRPAELQRWHQVAAELGKTAHAGSIAFCFENADDVRLMGEVEKIIFENPHVDICLDIGHLFERVKTDNTWEWLAGRFCDRYLPLTSLFGKGTPFYEIPSWTDFLQKHAGRIRCVHLHNHNGQISHCPVTSGKINIVRMLRSMSDFYPLPVIIEADYRQAGIRQLRKDLAFMEEVMA